MLLLSLPYLGLTFHDSVTQLNEDVISDAGEEDMDLQHREEAERADRALALKEASEVAEHEERLRSDKRTSQLYSS